MEHSCLLIQPRETDYILGNNSPIKFKRRLKRRSLLQVLRGLPTADWVPYFTFFERQKFSWDTCACVLFTAQEDFDAEINQQIEAGQIPQALLHDFAAMGYMDTGADGKLHFHSSPRFLHVLAATKFDGTAMPNAWDIIRKYGVLPDKDLPFNENTTVEEYFKAITPAQLLKASQLLQLIGGKDSTQYHWVNNGGAKNIQKIQQALLQGPLCLGVALLEPGWDQPVPLNPPQGQAPQHAVAGCRIVGANVTIFDHYDPFQKTLDAGYPIPYVLQGIVTVNYTPAPVPSPNPIPSVIEPTQQNVNILSAIVLLYQKIIDLLNRLKGRKFSSTTMFSNENKFINWIVVSSEDPTKVAATVKGAAGLFITFLALFVHGQNFSDLPDQVYSVVVSIFGLVSAAITLAGLVRKIWNSFVPAQQ